MWYQLGDSNLPAQLVSQTREIALSPPVHTILYFPCILQNKYNQLTLDLHCIHIVFYLSTASFVHHSLVADRGSIQSARTSNVPPPPIRRDHLHYNRLRLLTQSVHQQHPRKSNSPRVLHEVGLRIPANRRHTARHYHHTFKKSQFNLIHPIMLEVFHFGIYAVLLIALFITTVRLFDTTQERDELIKALNYLITRPPTTTRSHK